MKCSGRFHNYYPSRPIHSRVISISWEAYQMPQTCKARTLNNLTRFFTVYRRVPLLHMDEVRK